ncbi:Cerato-platanin-domain-containing protein [Chiua virens]|nr:Cerato-platanin-domain-containing protein [Chiua virens]
MSLVYKPPSLLLSLGVLGLTMYSLATLLALILTFISGLRVLAQTTTTLSYDNNYDNAALSLNQIACSDGSNGLEAKSASYTTLGSLPLFPNVGGVYTVEGWNSPQCGACYAVTYGSNVVNILAVDVSRTGFTVSQAAMDALTGGQAAALGRVDVTFAATSPSACGLQN